MSIPTESNLCSMCNKSSARCFCIGCKKYFCSKDFKTHEQQLWTQFDNEVVNAHNELWCQIEAFDYTKCLSSDLFDQIEQWKITTIQKVEKAAERAHHQLIESINKSRICLHDELVLIRKEIHCRREEENFIETDIDQLKQKIDRIRQKLEQYIGKDRNESIVVTNDQIDWNQIIYISNIEDKNANLLLTNTMKPFVNKKWIQRGVIVAGGNGEGINLSQLKNPWGLCVDDKQTVYIADYANHRVVQWKYGETTGRVVAGGRGHGDHSDQLNCPVNVMIDKETDTLIISDYGNKRLVRWSRHDGTYQETILSGVGCWGLAIDNNRCLYVVDYDKHEVKRYRLGEKNGIIVAGGHGSGSELNQLSYPGHIFIDANHSVYVSDSNNHRIMKWIKDMKNGIVVAGGSGQGNNLNQLSSPCGVFVDSLDTIYVADAENHRILRWSPRATQGNIIVGKTSDDNQNGELNLPAGLTFDQDNNLYVTEYGNHQVKKYFID